MRFFVRTSADKATVEKVFGTVEYIDVPEVTGETGFLTAVMKEKDYEQKAAELGNVLQMIRFH